MKIMALDPSTTATGYAIAVEGKITKVGKYTPTGKDAIARIDDTVAYIGELLKWFLNLNPYSKLPGMPAKLIIEVPSGHVHGNIKAQRNTRGLSLYGMAVGAVRQAARALMPWEDIRHVDQNAWKHRKPKEYFQAMAKIFYPGYTVKGDCKGDIADAICLCEFFIRTLQIEERARR